MLPREMPMLSSQHHTFVPQVNLGFVLQGLVFDFCPLIYSDHVCQLSMESVLLSTGKYHGIPSS